MFIHWTFFRARIQRFSRWCPSSGSCPSSWTGRPTTRSPRDVEPRSTWSSGFEKELLWQEVQLDRSTLKIEEICSLCVKTERMTFMESSVKSEFLLVRLQEWFRIVGRFQGFLLFFAHGQLIVQVNPDHQGKPKQIKKASEDILAQWFSTIEARRPSNLNVMHWKLW